jgi:hypothetical protein
MTCLRSSVGLGKRILQQTDRQTATYLELRVERWVRAPHSEP